MILDILFIEKLNLLILGTVNNYLILYEFSQVKNELIYINKFFCPDKCIVYSMSLKNFNFFYEEISENSKQKNIYIIIASGTVFRKIIYWCIYLQFYIEENFSENKISLQNFHIKKLAVLQGHEGVIFNLEIINPYKIISVSDDRTCKIWNLSDNININQENHHYFIFIKIFQIF